MWHMMHRCVYMQPLTLLYVAVVGRCPRAHTRLQREVSADVRQRFLTPEGIVDVLRAGMDCGDLGLCNACMTFVVQQADAVAIIAPHNIELLAGVLQQLLVRTLQEA